MNRMSEALHEHDKMMAELIRELEIHRRTEKR